MLFDKYKRGRQHLNGGHQGVTYKKNLILTLRLTQNNQWVGVDHVARFHLLNSPPITSRVDKNKIKMMMMMMMI